MLRQNSVNCNKTEYIVRLSCGAFLDALASLKPVSLTDWLSFSDCQDNHRIHHSKWDRIVPISQFSHLLIKSKQRKKVRQRDKDVKLHIAVHQASCSSLHTVSYWAISNIINISASAVKCQMSNVMSYQCQMKMSWNVMECHGMSNVKCQISRSCEI